MGLSHRITNKHILRAFLMNIEKLDSMSPKALKAYLATLSRPERIKLANDLVTQLIDHANTLPDYIAEALETKLSTDEASQIEAQDLLRRVMTV
jgi:hypothetical protein